MGKGTIIFPLLGLTAIAFLLRKKLHTAEKLKYLPQGVKVTGKFPNYKVFFLLDITNPTDHALKVDNVFADVSIFGKVLGKVERTAPFDIQRSKTSHISFPVVISTGNIPALVQIVTKILKGDKNIIAKVEGTINAEGVETDINESYKLSV